MPVYEYYCHGCDDAVSVFFKTMSSAGRGVAACPRCGHGRLERLVSAVNLGARAATSSSDSSEAKRSSTNSASHLAKVMHEASKGGSRDLGSGFKEVAARLGKGEGATSIEHSMRKRVGEKMSPH